MTGRIESGDGEIVVGSHAARQSAPGNQNPTRIDRERAADRSAPIASVLAARAEAVSSVPWLYRRRAQIVGRRADDDRVAGRAVVGDGEALAWLPPKLVICVPVRLNVWSRSRPATNSASCGVRAARGGRRSATGPSRWRQPWRLRRRFSASASCGGRAIATSHRPLRSAKNLAQQPRETAAKAEDRFQPGTGGSGPRAR